MPRLASAATTLKDAPSDTNADERAIVRCGTTKGPIVLEFTRRWSPHGYDRAVYLFEHGFYDHTHFFRAVPNFLVQFGITYSHDAELVEMGNARTIPDDPQLDPPIPFDVGTISYAGSGPNSRTSQLFFSLTNQNANFGTELWETPIGVVTTGMDAIKELYHEYGDGPPFGHGPAQGRIHTGRAYIDEHFPLLDSFQECHTERIRPTKEPVVAGAAADAHAEAKGTEDSNMPSATNQGMDMQMVGGGLLLFIIVSVFVRSLVTSGQKDPKKRK